MICSLCKRQGEHICVKAEIVPTKVDICAPLQWHSYKTNYGGVLRSNYQIKDGSNYQLYTDVCYGFIPDRRKAVTGGGDVYKIFKADYSRA